MRPDPFMLAFPPPTDPQPPSRGTVIWSVIALGIIVIAAIVLYHLV